MAPQKVTIPTIPGPNDPKASPEAPSFESSCRAKRSILDTVRVEDSSSRPAGLRMTAATPCKIAPALRLFIEIECEIAYDRGLQAVSYLTQFKGGRHDGQ